MNLNWPWLKNVRVRKNIIRGGVLLFFLFCFCLCAQMALYVGAYKVQNLLKGNIERRTGKKVNIERTSMNIFTGLTFYGVEIYDDKTEYIKTRAIRVNIRFLPLLWQDIVISNLKVLAPEVYLTKEKSRKWSYLKFMPGNQNLDNLFLQSTKISLKDGKIILTDKTVSPSKSLILQGINIKSSASSYESPLFFEGDAYLSNQKGFFRVKGKIENFCYVPSLQLDFSGEKVPLYFLNYILPENIKLTKGNINLEARLNISSDINIKNSGTIRIENMDLRYDKSFFSNLSRKITYELDMKYKKNNIKIAKLNLNSGDIKLMGTGNIKNLSGPINWDINLKSYEFNLKEIEPIFNSWMGRDFARISGLTKLDKMEIKGPWEDIKVSGKLGIEKARINFLKSRADINRMEGQIIFDKYNFNIWQFTFNTLGINSLISGDIILGKNPIFKLESESKTDLAAFSKIFAQELKKRKLELKGELKASLNISGTLNDIIADIKTNTQKADITWYNLMRKRKGSDLNLSARLNYKAGIFYIKNGKGKIKKYKFGFTGIFPPGQGKKLDVIFNNLILYNDIGEIIIPLEDAKAKGKINGKISTYWDKKDEDFLKGNLDLEKVLLDKGWIRLESNGKVNFNRKKLFCENACVNGVKIQSVSADFILNGKAGLQNIKFPIGGGKVNGHVFMEYIKDKERWDIKLVFNKTDITKFYPLMGSWQDIIEGPVSGKINLKIPYEDLALTEGEVDLSVGPGKISKLKFLDEFAAEEKDPYLGYIKFSKFNIKGKIKDRMIEVKKDGINFQSKKLNIKALGKTRLKKDDNEHKYTVESRLAEWYAYKIPRVKSLTTILNLRDKTDSRIVLIFHILGKGNIFTVKWDTDKQRAAKKHSVPSVVKKPIENGAKDIFYEVFHNLIGQ
jgi:hypothetical protein